MFCSRSNLCTFSADFLLLLISNYNVILNTKYTNQRNELYVRAICIHVGSRSSHPFINYTQKLGNALFTTTVDIL